MSTARCGPVAGTHLNLCATLSNLGRHEQALPSLPCEYPQYRVSTRSTQLYLQYPVSTLSTL